MARLIILDRDGVINFDSPAFIKSPEEWHPLPGALDAIADLKHVGWQVAVCSNQSGIGRGLITPEKLEAIHACLRKALAERGVCLDGIAFCPHRPDEDCSCRKPLPGMLIDTMSQFDANPANTVVIGDSLRDIEAGLAAGCRCILVRTGNGRAAEASVRALGITEVFDDLRAAADKLLGELPWL
jgi:D-glycero-D-manno-heptose 1,7-bisphosphate phosphatase